MPLDSEISAAASPYEHSPEELAEIRENALRAATDRQARLIFDAALRLKQATPTQSIEDCVEEAERVWDWLTERTRDALSTRESSR